MRPVNFEVRRTYRLYTECDEIVKELADGYPFKGYDSPALRYIILDWWNTTGGRLGTFSAKELLDIYNRR